MQTISAMFLSTTALDLGDFNPKTLYVEVSKLHSLDAEQLSVFKGGVQYITCFD